MRGLAYIGFYLVWLAFRAYAALRPRVEIPVNGTPYLTRYYLSGNAREIRAALARGETGMSGIYLHKFHAADVDRRLHSHPYEYAVAIILRGGYTELRAMGDREAWIHEYRAGDVSRITPSVWHRIAALHGETWTLFRAGPKHGRGWGFRD